MFKAFSDVKNKIILWVCLFSISWIWFVW